MLVCVPILVLILLLVLTLTLVLVLGLVGNREIGLSKSGQVILFRVLKRATTSLTSEYASNPGIGWRHLTHVALAKCWVWETLPRIPSTCHHHLGKDWDLGIQKHKVSLQSRHQCSSYHRMQRDEHTNHHVVMREQQNKSWQCIGSHTFTKSKQHFLELTTPSRMAWQCNLDSALMIKSMAKYSTKNRQSNFNAMPHEPMIANDHVYTKIRRSCLHVRRSWHHRGCAKWHARCGLQQQRSDMLDHLQFQCNVRNWHVDEEQGAHLEPNWRFSVGVIALFFARQFGRIGKWIASTAFERLQKPIQNLKNEIDVIKLKQLQQTQLEVAPFYLQLIINGTFPPLSRVPVFGKDLAFWSCSFETITIPKTLTNIESSMHVRDLGIVMLANALQLQRQLTISKSVTSSRLHVTGLGIVMLFKEAIFKRNVTDSGIATVTTRLHSLKAPAGISVIEDGMLTWRPSAWMASFVAASTSFLLRRPTNASAKGRKPPFGAGVCHFGLGMQQRCKLQCGSSCHNVLTVRSPGFGAQWDLDNVFFQGKPCLQFFNWCFRHGFNGGHAEDTTF